MSSRRDNGGVGQWWPLPPCPLARQQITTTMADPRTEARNDADLSVAVAAPDPKNVQELTKYVSEGILFVPPAPSVLGPRGAPGRPRPARQGLRYHDNRGVTKHWLLYLRTVSVEAVQGYR